MALLGGGWGLGRFDTNTGKQARGVGTGTVPWASHARRGRGRGAAS